MTSRRTLFNALCKCACHSRQTTPEVRFFTTKMAQKSSASAPVCGITQNNGYSFKERCISSMLTLKQQQEQLKKQRNCNKIEENVDNSEHLNINNSACPSSRADSHSSVEISENTIPAGCPFSSKSKITKPSAEEVSSLANAKPFHDIPGPRGLPVLGNALKYSALGPYRFEKILDNRLTYARKYGNIYREKLGQMDMVHIFDPSDLATMFRLEGQYPSRGAIANLELTYLKRNKKLVGFAFLDGPEWARQRQIIQKAMMHPTAATRYLHMQVPVVQDFVDYLDHKKEADGLVPDLYEDLFKYTMEAIGTVCFDERLGTFRSDGQPSSPISHQLTSAISETFYCFRQCMFSVPLYQYVRTPMYRRFEKASNLMREIMAEHVQRVADKVTSKRGSGSDLSEEALCPFTVGLLQEDRSMFEVLLQDDRATKELAVNLIMALFRTGIDSTGNALAFLLYNLARNPDKQQKLHDEIEAVLSHEPLSPEAISKMTYLKAAIKESFRLNFPVFGGSGRVLPTDVVLSGYKVPKGKFLFANMAAMGVMEEYFPRPKEYHPERWLRDERAMLQTTHSKDAAFISLPFSAGMRACPGKRFAEQALCLAVVNILQKFRLEHHAEEVGMIHMPFTTPDKPLNIQFFSRAAENGLAAQKYQTPLVQRHGFAS